MKTLKLQSKENNTVRELVAEEPIYKETLKKIQDNYEFMIFKKEGNKLVRHNVYSTKNKAKTEARKLNKRGIKTVIVDKEKTPNQHDGVFLVQNGNDDVNYVIGLDAALKVLNAEHKKDMHLRKQQGHKETIGYIAFGLKPSTNEFVCTRLKPTEEEALKMIFKRHGVSSNTVRCFRVARYYKGFEFKHQDLEDCNRIKEAKAKLSEI